ncbi:MAG: energy transducer TonB [Sphingomonadaceae bacterium]|nr:energy transducer TonB [Sphingomonadaceae bacterium]
MLPLLLMLAAADAPVAVEPAAPHPPILAYPDRPLVYFSDYPAAALREGRSGTAIAELTISNRGEVESCAIIRSSGHRDLDNVTCRALAIRAAFLPARAPDGRRVTARVNQPVRWDAAAILAARAQGS